MDQEQETGSQRASLLVRSAAWMLSARLLERTLGLASTAVLARLLTPADFGLVAMAVAVTAAIELIGAFGFDWALVKQRSIERSHLDTAWTLRITLSTSMFIAILVFAAPAASYYGEPRVQGIMYWLGAGLLVAGFENPGVIHFRRDFRFAREFALRTSTKLLGAIIAVTTAVIFRSYWALLAGALASRVTSTLLSYAMHPFRPRLDVSRRQELFAFSGWLFLNNLAGFLKTRLADLFIGRVSGPRSLGLYSVSSELAHLAISEISAPINRAMYSSYSAHQSDISRVRLEYERVSAVIWLVALPAAIGMALLAPEVIYLILGPNWLDGAPVLRILAISGAIALLPANTSYVFMALGYPRIVLGVNIVSILALAIGLVFLVPRHGPAGAALAYLAAVSISVPVTFFFLKRLVGTTSALIRSTGMRLIISSLVLALVVGTLRPPTLPQSMATALLSLSLLSLVGAISYFVSLYFLWRLSGRPDGPEVDLLELARRTFLATKLGRRAD